MKAVLLVPRRRDDGHRDALWEYCRARWEQYLPDVPVFEGHHDDGPFNRAAAINRAARLAGDDWDVGVVIDSDIMRSTSAVREAIRTAHRTGQVTWSHRRWRGVSEQATARVLKTGHDFGPELDRDELDLVVDRTTPLSWSCCIAIPHAVFDDLGGFDERFRGWGFEDMAFQASVAGLYGYRRVEGDVVHLWHPRSGERIAEGEGRATAAPEYVVNALLGRRYMVALRRDHKRTDRSDDVSAEDLARDIRNLERDDARFGMVARRLGLPDWSDWWPTLEELLEGAREAARGPAGGTVTVVVHSGGIPERWPERRAYLERALASLATHLRGPVVQRVVYDCWGDATIRDELSAIAVPHGFYVVGPDARPDYTAGRRALWRYLERRATGTYVFGTEDDFELLRDVDTVPMIEALATRPYLAQMALLRDAFYERERARPGILGWPRESFDEAGSVDGARWLEHRNFWTANPSLFRRSLTRIAWPRGDSSERLFGDALFRDPRARSAFWGQGEEWVRHIGTVRAADAGY